MPPSPRPPHTTLENTAEHGVSQPQPQALEDWVTRSWDQGLQLEHVEDLDIVRVETRNSSYSLAVVAGREGEVLVRGGRYFREWTRVHLLGCSLGGALLKRHGVHVGMRMEFSWAGRRIVTSHVHAVVRDAAPRPAVAC